MPAAAMKSRTIEQLVLVATTYRLALDQQRSPVDAVAARLGVTYEAAKQRIRRARRAGLLAEHQGRFDKSRPSGDTQGARRMP